MRVRNFSRLALVFVVLFTLLVAGVFFPFQPLDPAWQSRLTAALVNAATLPLLALALLELARHLDPCQATSGIGPPATRKLAHPVRL
jgi:hypothetical protein